MLNEYVKIIGAGLAGTEAALFLANNGIKVKLYDIKPKKFTPAHSSKNFAELVCSNSLKSNDFYGNAAGLLKEEMRNLGSEIIKAADQTKVPAGNALAVNRELFSQILTKKLKENKNIEIICDEVQNINTDEYTIIATGPLSTESISSKIKELCGNELGFFDASAPIVTFESLDMNYAFCGDRYEKGNGDHINCSLTKDEYLLFVNELLKAEKADKHSFEKADIFEGCMPIEVMAERGIDTLRFGPLKPVGLTDPKTNRWPYACLQLRKEDEKGTMFNLVGFQTSLKFPEQKRVFGIIPALKNAEYVRYGVMHRNTFINSTKVLSNNFSLKQYPKVFFAGQITGVEGYVESACSGLLSGIFIFNEIKNKQKISITDKTVCGSLIRYITTKNENFQPMNANYAILPPLDEIIKDKNIKKREYAKRSLAEIEKFKESYLNG